MRVLVTGGAGYIGSHVVLALVEDEHDVVVIDDLSTGDPRRVPADLRFVRGNLGDPDAVRDALAGDPFDAVVHLAASKAVGESVRLPMRYYEQNVVAWRTLLEQAMRAGVGTVLLTSSAAVYGSAAVGVVDEEVVPQPQSPYGRTKLAGEWLLADVAVATGLRWGALRLFNVAGAGKPELEDVAGENLVPQLFGALDRGESCRVFGDTHPTPDGTCVRDYVHVTDVAEAHVAALRAAADGDLDDVCNVGTGRGVSVLEMVNTVRQVTGEPLPHQIVEPRIGDPAWVVADVSLIAKKLGWHARYDVDDIVRSAWQARHPG